MRAQELMIGDWIQRNGKNFQVTSIMDGYISTDEHSDSHDYHFKPIPLTPEVLEHSGFVGDDNGNYDYHDYVWVKFLHRTSECLFVRCKTSIHEYIGEPIYVHELQHILRFCGLAELADNFKV